MTLIKRTCMRDQIRDVIVTRILDGTYPPDTHLKELALAHEFNVSQAPVREALRELEMLGLVISERYRGTHVRSTNKKELSEAYELRAILEDRAAQLAVPCSKENLAILREALAVMRKTAVSKDYPAYTAAALKFHRSIIEFSHNSVFLRTWESMLWEVRSRIAVQIASDNLTRFLDAHDDVITALAKDDGNLAGKILRNIMETFRTSLSEQE